MIGGGAMSIVGVSMIAAYPPYPELWTTNNEQRTSNNEQGTLGPH